MTKPVVQRPRADEDIDYIFAFLRGDSVQAAANFLDAVEAAYELLSEQPGIGSPRHSEFCPELPYPLRFLPINHFPRILIYYMNRPEAVEVIRVWDAARGLAALVAEME